MDEKDFGKLIHFLKDKWQERRCPMCHAAQWAVQVKVFELREYHGGDMVLGAGPIVPVIPVTCGNCGNTILLNAIKSGIVSAEEEEASD